MEQISLFPTQKHPSTDWRWEYKDYPKEKNGLTVFSCFSGGGGSTMGYKLAGCEVLGNVELDRSMNELYLKNHHPRYNFCMDLREFNELPDDVISRELFDLDILDGSPPCTTFSMCGHREKSWGKKKKFREGQKEQTLDDLSFVFIETAKKLKPKVVIMENVDGLIAGEAFVYLQNIYKDLMSNGYRVNHWLLKSENMGIPQRRHRVFFVAIRQDLELDPTWIDMSFDYEKVIYGDIKTGQGQSLGETTETLKWLSRCQETDKKLSHVVLRYGEPEKLYHHIIAWEKDVMQTITAGGEMYRGTDKTRISVEDIINSQTFPQDYVFPRRTYPTVKYVCGMSVPPVMMKRVVQRLIDQGVFDYKLKKEE